MKKFPLIYWLPVPLYYAFITYLSGTTPVFPSFYSETTNLDKVFHFVEYMFLGLVLARDLFWQQIYRKSERKKMATFLFIIVTLIFADELHQYFTPNRMMDIFDGIADFIGASFGAFLFTRFVRGKSYSTATVDDLMTLRGKDERRFAVLLVPTIFFMVLTINVLQIKAPVEARYPLLASFFDFSEWAFLGYICHRAFYFNAMTLRVKVGPWLGLIVLGVGLIFSYRYLVTGLEVSKIENAFLIEIGVYYVCGILISFLRRLFGSLKELLIEDPSYKRETLQRLYYFYIPILVGFLIVVFSTLSPRQMAERWMIHSPGEIGIYFVLFFILAIMSFRAVSWECWWHERSRRKVIWLFSSMALISLVVFSEFLKSVLGGRVTSPALPVLNVFAMIVAFAVYALGMKLARTSLTQTSKRASYQKLSGASHGGNHDRC